MPLPGGVTWKSCTVCSFCLSYVLAALCYSLWAERQQAHTSLHIVQSNFIFNSTLYVRPSSQAPTPTPGSTPTPNPAASPLPLSSHRHLHHRHHRHQHNHCHLHHYLGRCLALFTDSASAVVKVTTKRERTVIVEHRAS